MSTYFTLPEAQSKLEKTIITKIPFYQVPHGSIGKVTDIYEMGNLRYGLIIAWNGSVISDGFSKDEYEEFLREV
jgi:hypothetical protein